MSAGLAIIAQRPEPVVVTQPVHQHAYESAVSAQEAGLLRCFVTGLYWTGAGPLATVVRRLPAATRSRVDAELRRRVHPELDSQRVVSLARHHLAALALRRGATTLGLPGRADPAEVWAHQCFDRRVGRLLPQLEDVKIVHAFMGAASATFRSGRRSGQTTVLDVPIAYEAAAAVLSQGGDSGTRPLDRRIREERALADILLAPSAFVTDGLVEHGVPRERIVQLPYGVDPALFKPPQAARDDGVFRVLFVGQIGARKGVGYLLEAWRRLALPRSELVLVGTPDATGRRLLSEYEGLYRWVRAVPKHEVQSWFERSDVFAFPTLAEGSAIVSYEALAAGLPLVTTANCGSVARDGSEGFLVEPRDTDALAERLQFLSRNPDARCEMGRRGRALIEERYTWGHYRANLAALYAAILAGAPLQPAMTASAA